MGKNQVKFERGWSGRIVLRYSLIQLPGAVIALLVLILVRRWLGFDYWIVWLGLFLWVAKDAALFPFVWRSYDWEVAQGTDAMIGERGVAEERLAPSGYVRVRGELWQAKTAGPGDIVEKGGVVKVVGGKGLVLTVVVPDQADEEYEKVQVFDNADKT